MSSPRANVHLLTDASGLSRITTVGRYDTVEEAQLATDEVWEAR